MTVIDLKVHHEPSPFTFDVLRCPNCGYVETLERYRTSAMDLRCSVCGKVALREYELWPGKVSTSGGMNFIKEEIGFER